MFLNPSVADFKLYFNRDFPYLPIWDYQQVYSINDIVQYTDGYFYKAKNDSVTSLPTDTNDWDKIESQLNDYILDSDIQKAINEAITNINQGIFINQNDYNIGIYYLTAHLLCSNLLASSQGLNAMPTWLTNSKSVGNVSESYQIPEKILLNPYLSFLSTTNYGAKYVSIIYSRSRGNVKTFQGTTSYL